MNTTPARRPVGLIAFGLIVLLVIVLANLGPVFAQSSAPPQPSKLEILAVYYTERANIALNTADQLRWGGASQEAINYFKGRSEAYLEAALQARDLDAAP